MKRMLCTILCSALLLCGCQSAAVGGSETQAPATEKVTETVTEAVTEPVAEAVTEPQAQLPGVTLPFGEPEAGNIAIGQTGRVRVAYTNNVSSVRYITSVDQLPDNEALAAYDEAYFESKALLVVLETVGSGSVEVDIASAENGVVTLSHELPGDVGTADMATWLLWAEVEAGLDYEWSVANPALRSDTSAY